MKKSHIMTLAALASVIGVSAQTPSFTPIGSDFPGASAVTLQTAKSGSVMLSPSKIKIDAPDGETFQSIFSSQEEFDKWLLVDGNEDGLIWMYSSNTDAATGPYDAAIANDDWMISEGFQLEKGQTYIISASAMAPNGANWPQRFEIKIGTERKAEAMTLAVLEPTVVIDKEYVPYGEYFEAPETGTYYLGVHEISDAHRAFLAVKQVKVSSPGAVGLPEDVEYTEDVLYQSDFSGLAGTWENPVDVIDESTPFQDSYYALKGVPGWGGTNVLAGGDCLIINGLANADARLLPPLVTTKGYDRVRVEVTAQVHTLSANASQYGGRDYLDGDWFLSHSSLANAWRYYNYDFTLDNIPVYPEPVELSQEVIMPTEAMTIYGTDESGASTSWNDLVPDQLYASFKAYWGSDLAVKNYKVIGLKPFVAAPSNLNYSNFADDGFDISWTASENAKDYMVIVYSTTYSIFADASLPYSLTREQMIKTADTKMHIDFPTDKCVVVEVIGLNDDTRSPSSGYLGVFAINAPVLETVAKEDDETLRLTWDGTDRATTLFINAREGEKVTADNDAFPVVDADFSTLPSEDPEGEHPWTRYLDDPYSWVLYGQSWVEDGALVVDNGPAMWGNPSFSLESDFYDFTPLTSEITVKATMKASSEDMSVYAIMHGWNEDLHKYSNLFVSEEQPLTPEFKEYTFTLPADQKDVLIALSAYGYDKIYVKDLKVTGAIKEGTTFYRTYFSGGLDMEAHPGLKSALLPAPASERSEFNMRQLRTEHNEWTTYMSAYSPFSNTLRMNTSGVESVQDGNNAGPAMYYNMQGQRVLNPKNGIYIRVQNGKAQKVIVK